MSLQPLGSTGLHISSVTLGCWPIAGMTSLGVNDADSLATIQECFDLGINFLDTAYAYGPSGESERLICQALGTRRQEIVIATKGGIEWGPGRQQIVDGRPATIRRHCEESLRRLGTDRVELYYLHAPDPRVPIADSAGAIRELIADGKALSAGVSNVGLEQLREFAAACPLTAYQPAYNMLQRGIEGAELPWCREHNVAVAVYWPLMKGLLAGRLRRDAELPVGDSRRKYPMFQGAEWQKNQDLVDALRAIAAQAGRSVAQLVINWTIHQPGITTALCGAKRPDQIRENAGAMDWRLSAEQLAAIDAALAARGTALTRAPV
jgi:aryl-alcohol dehydrogenase-like predicted oxidoreductase